MGLLEHRELMIIKGVGKTPGDTASAEQDPVVLDLMDRANGFSLTEDGWTPNIPSLKGGGLWADSPISDGRTLLSGQNTNVVETMRVQVSGTTNQLYAAAFARLQRMIQDCRDFFDTQWQIEPIYLRWWAAEAPGPQFALIYNIDLDVEFSDSSSAQSVITLSVERDYSWRGVRPGGNPKEWTYYALNLGKFTPSAADLSIGSDHLFMQSIQNKREWNAGQTALVSQNHVTIPAANIPGDLPALTYLTITRDAAVSQVWSQAYIGRSTKPNITDRSGVVRLPNYVLNAVDGGLGTDATRVNDTGAPIGNAGVTAQRVRVTYATTTDAIRVSWANASVPPQYFDATVARGRYMCFLRARLSAAANSVNLYLKAVNESLASVTLPTQVLSGVGGGGTGNTTYWELLYMGILQVPLGPMRSLSKNSGLGIEAGSQVSIYLYSSRNTGATADLYVSDLILIPIDETVCKIDIGTAGSLAVGTGDYMVADNTGYNGHGMTDDTFLYTYNPVQGTGEAPKLLPKVDNKLNFLIVNSGFSDLDTDITVRIDIIPRWSGIRDK